MTLLSRIKRMFSGTPNDASGDAPHDHPDEPASRHDRREAGRERHHETGEPAWEASDRIEEPPGAGKKNPDAAPEILGGN